MTFDAFIAKYMGDDRPSDEVEERARQLNDTLRKHRESLSPARRFNSLAQLTTWFQEQQQQIRLAKLDSALEEVLLINLETQYDELLRRFLQEM